MILIRNLDIPCLYNRTYILLTEYRRYVIKGNIIGRTFDGSEVVLYKIPLQSKDGNKYIPTPFTRKQFPIYPAFIITINKLQGQLIKYIGLNLRSRPVFTYRQFYISNSRITIESNLYMISLDSDNYIRYKLINNPVYKQVLL